MWSLRRETEEREGGEKTYILGEGEERQHEAADDGGRAHGVRRRAKEGGGGEEVVWVWGAEAAASRTEPRWSWRWS